MAGPAPARYQCGMKYLLATAFLLGACAHHQAPCSGAEGEICAGGALTDEAAMISALRGADIVIPGETHDNPAHHRWQAKLAAELAPRTIAFEMIPEAREADANAAQAEGRDIGEAIDWAGSGWPDWAMYRQIIDAAPGALITGGGRDRETIRLAAAEGAAAAFGPGAARFGLDSPLAPDVLASMLAEQQSAHCGMMPEEMLPRMVEVQRLRDAAFAAAALRGVEEAGTPAFLITGSGHARNDRGAPAYLHEAAPGLKVISVGLIEAGTPPERATLYDFAIFTAAQSREDPCAAFRAKAAPAPPDTPAPAG